MWRVVFISLFLASAALPAAIAQDAEPTVVTEAEKRRAAEKAREEAELRIEAEMVTMTSLVEALSKNLGQMHYLRTLCFGPGDQKWRDYASQMMNIEGRDNPESTKRLIRAFNAGYYQEQERHQTCNKNVSVDVAALSENGRHISSMLGDPYRDF